MNRRIRLLGFVLVVCFVILFVQLNNLQVRQSGSLDASKYQPPPPGKVSTNYLPRGEIVSSDGVVLAESIPSTTPNDPYGDARVYPLGSLFADVTGYYDAVDVNSTGLENEYNSYLITHESAAATLRQLLTTNTGTDSMSVTVSARLQRVAADALAPYSQGAVVAIDPQTGAVLAMYGKPTYDPNRLAGHNPKALAAYFKSLDPNSGASPLVNYPVAHPWNPGSTFKVITTAAIFDHDTSIEGQTFPVLRSLKVPGTVLLLHNFGGEACGGPLAQILAASCDTAYAKVGLELGAASLYSEATAFGLNSVPPIDLPSYEVAPSCFPPVENRPDAATLCFTPQQIVQNPGLSIGPGNQPFIAYSAIGQGNVQETALQNALVAAGIADGGTIMAPHLMQAIANDEGQIVDAYKPHAWRVATTSDTADTVRNLMLAVASNGTATGVFPAPLDVAAKTGTAETGLTNCSSTWMIATAPAGATETPKVAVAAVIPAQAGIGCSETGAEVAGPVVAKVLEAALGYKG